MAGAEGRGGLVRGIFEHITDRIPSDIGLLPRSTNVAPRPSSALPIDRS